MRTPQPGEVYRHYKSVGGDHHTYEVVGLAKHSETQELMVGYQPLFDGENTWLGDASMGVRPLEMWAETVVVDGRELLRFTLVE